MAIQISASLAKFAAAVALAGTAAGAGGPSFYCARANTADERAICRSPALRAADARMASLYHDIQGCTMMGGHGDNIDLQRDWLARRARRARCGGNTACLARSYHARIAEFAPMAAKARQLLRAEQCPGPLR